MDEKQIIQLHNLLLERWDVHIGRNKTENSNNEWRNWQWLISHKSTWPNIYFTSSTSLSYISPFKRKKGGSVFILTSLHHSEMVVQEECDTCPINDLFFSFLGDEWINRWSLLFEQIIQHLMLVLLSRCNYLI